MSDKIFYMDDFTTGKPVEERAKWIRGLNTSGYAGIKTPEGYVVDRREFPNAIPIKANSIFGVAKPKILTDEQIKEANKKNPED